MNDWTRIETTLGPIEVLAIRGTVINVRTIDDSEIVAYGIAYKGYGDLTLTNGVWLEARYPGGFSFRRVDYILYSQSLPSSAARKRIRTALEVAVTKWAGDHPEAFIVAETICRERALASLQHRIDAHHKAIAELRSRWQSIDCGDYDPDVAYLPLDTYISH